MAVLSALELTAMAIYSETNIKPLEPKSAEFNSVGPARLCEQAAQLGTKSVADQRVRPRHWQIIKEGKSDKIGRNNWE